MSRTWPERQLDRVTPPQANDIRGKAFLSAINQLLGGHQMPGIHSLDPDTCRAEVLPALIAELSMEEFIDPNLPEHVQRRILKQAWHLQSLKGYDAGVQMGLSLLGMKMNIKHWYQQEPMGPPNTHEIDFLVGESLFEENVILGPRTIAAAHHMINATKRWSQESSIRIGVDVQSRLAITAIAAPPLQINRGTACVRRPTTFKAGVSMTVAASAVQVHRIFAQAA